MTEGSAFCEEASRNASVYWGSCMAYTLQALWSMCIPHGQACLASANRYMFLTCSVCHQGPGQSMRQ